jgi:type II secretion system protein G
MKPGTPAFTLIELLVVIAILGLLAALLLPALARGRDQAQSTICRSNLSGIGKALAAYTADSERYPGTRITPLRVPPRTPQDWTQVWDRRLLTYASGNTAIFGCPSDQPPHAIAYYSLTNYSYGYNAYGSGVLPPELNLGLGHAQIPETASTLILEVGEAQVKLPADMIAVGDLTDHPQVFTTALTPVLLPPYAGGPAARHSDGANMLFCDGHVLFAKQAKWIAATDTARSRWNNDHEPHPENWR